VPRAHPYQDTGEDPRGPAALAFTQRQRGEYAPRPLGIEQGASRDLANALARRGSPRADRQRLYRFNKPRLWAVLKKIIK